MKLNLTTSPSELGNEGFRNFEDEISEMVKLTWGAVTIPTITKFETAEEPKAERQIYGEDNND